MGGQAWNEAEAFALSASLRWQSLKLADCTQTRSMRAWTLAKKTPGSVYETLRAGRPSKEIDP